MKNIFSFLSRLFIPFCVMMFLGACVVLFYSAERVQTLRANVIDVEKKIAQEKEAYRVLATEWAYLNTPERLETMAQQHLRLKPKSARQYISLERVPVLSDLENNENVLVENDGIEWSDFGASDYLARQEKLQKKPIAKKQKLSPVSVSLQGLWQDAGEQ